MTERVLFTLCIAAAVTATSFGQSDGPAPASSPATQADTPKDAGGDLLAGPKVVEAEDATGGTRSMIGIDGKQPEIMPRKWFMLLRELNLKAEQRAMVRRITGELAAERKVYNDKYGKDLSAIRTRMRERRQRNEGPSVEDRERLSIMLEAAPKAGPYQERVWKILTEAQRAEMTKLIDEVIKARKQRRDAANGTSSDRPSDRKVAGREERDERAKRRSRFLTERRATGKSDSQD